MARPPGSGSVAFGTGTLVLDLLRRGCPSSSDGVGAADGDADALLGIAGGGAFHATVWMAISTAAFFGGGAGGGAGSFGAAFFGGGGLACVAMSTPGGGFASGGGGSDCVAISTPLDGGAPPVAASAVRTVVPVAASTVKMPVSVAVSTMTGPACRRGGESAGWVIVAEAALPRLSLRSSANAASR